MDPFLYKKLVAVRSFCIILINDMALESKHQTIKDIEIISFPLFSM
jgi:hypothetical protein